MSMKTDGKDPYIYCVHRIHDQRMCVDCHDDAIRNAIQKENERCVDIAKSWELSPGDERHDNAAVQEGDGTSHNKACRWIANAIALAPLQRRQNEQPH